MGFFDVVGDIVSLPVDIVHDQISLNGAIDNDGDSHTMDRLRKITRGESGKTMISQSDALKLIRASINNNKGSKIDHLNKEINLYAICIKDNKESNLEIEDEFIVTYINDIPHFGNIMISEEEFKLGDWEYIKYYGFEENLSSLEKYYLNKKLSNN